MQTIDMTILASVTFLISIILFSLWTHNRKLRNENIKLKEILEIKTLTITNYEASRVAVTDVIENFSLLPTVMSLISQGDSKAASAKKLNLPLERIELIIKLDTLKKKGK
ncbi:MAG: sigma-70 family RNA polymerase sigma factor [Epsilonproteobacteria bacterium]|nr:MAG: sigma-70 family RNA polymerase sigma factor [Campylobacterota bacterium]